MKGKYSSALQARITLDKLLKDIQKLAEERPLIATDVINEAITSLHALREKL
jgi:hypothetical protein